MSAQYPSAIVTPLQLSVAYDNYSSTTAGNSGGGIGPTTTTINVTAAPPGANCIVTLGQGPMSEQVLISSISGTTLTVASGGRGYGGSTAQSWTDPTVISINEVAFSHNQLALEVAAIETALGVGVGNYVANTVQVNGDGTTISGGGNLSANRTFAVINDSSTQRIGVEQSGTLTSTRKQLNFIPANGINILVADNSGSNRADVLISSAGSPVLPKTATYQVLAADFTSFSTITVASGTFTITLVASTSQPMQGQWIKVLNYGSGVVTVARSGQNINNQTTSLPLAPATGLTPTETWIVSDGSNYFASVSGMLAVSKAGTLIGTESSINFIQGSGTTLTVTDNPTNKRVDVTVAATSTYIGPTNVVDQTSSRSSGTAYQNTTGKTMYVLLTSNSGGSTMQVNSDASNPPTTSVLNINGGSVAQIQGLVIVIPTFWYELTGSFSQWLESW